MQDESRYRVHICLYSHSLAPFDNIFSTNLGPQQQTGPPSKHSLDEIQRKVDRPLDARFTPLSLQALDLPKRKEIHSSIENFGMSPKQGGHRKISGGPQTPSPRRAADTSISRKRVESPSQSPIRLQSTSTSSAASSTPVARFIKESSFSVEDDEEGYIHRQRSLEISFGIVHLFRDDAALQDFANAKTKTALEDDTGVILAILGVPSHIGPSDFLQFVEPATNAISQVRMIREERAQRCMVLLKFREATSAEEFHKMYADQPFDAHHDPDELCRVVYVTKVTISTTSTLPYAYPLLANSDPWPIMTSNIGSSSSHHSDTTTLTHRLAGIVPVELPTCPVCLERMDASVTGLMTVTCQHTFHCSCLSRWSDSRCPVCRYTQSRMIKKGQFVTPSFIPEHGCCAICGTGSDLWVCLICATVGCGRYKAGHAHRHHQETGHLYSLELETQRVWDYAGDGYVHRLIQNKAESKTIDNGGPTPTAFREPTISKESRQMEASGSLSGQPRHGKGEEMSEVEEKMEAIGLEYSHLLSTQLESQRAFYEDQVRVFQRRMEEAESNHEQMKWQTDQTEQERKEVKRNLEVMTSRYESVHKHLEKSLGRMKSLDEGLQGERLMSKGLIGKIEKLEGESENSRRDMQKMRLENQELKEQVRDLMIFLETRDTIEKEGGEEMRGGDVAVGKGKKSSTTTTLTSNELDNNLVASNVEDKPKTATKSKKKRAKGKSKATADSSKDVREGEGEGAEREEQEQEGS